MIKKLLQSIAVFVGVIASVVILHASESKKMPANLCLEYTGTFDWDDKNFEAQKVQIRLDSIKNNINGRIEAAGTGIYVSDSKTSYSKVQMQVDRASLRFEMRDSNLDDPDFISDGSYVGKISADFLSIHATWTTRSTGEKGLLRLKAHKSCQGIST